jgi:hypothetical protein
MSTYVLGDLDLDPVVDNYKKANIAFLVTKIATDNRIGVKLGYNVLPELLKELKKEKTSLPFELLDSPMTNVAEELFSGDGVRILERHIRVDSGESLSSRMARVNHFLADVLLIDVVNKIDIYIDTGFGEDIVLKTEVCNFTSVMLEIYKREKNFIPGIQLTITR